MEFEALLCAARQGDATSKERLFFMYRPLIIKSSMVEGSFREDLYQVLSLTFLKCIDKFDVENAKERSKKWDAYSK